MKRNFLYSAMAAVMSLCATSCSQEEIVNESNGGGIATINVSIAGQSANTRALPTAVEGHQLRCLMQVVNLDNQAIAGEEYRKAVAVNAEGDATFQFTKPEGDYKVLFWADYVKAGADVNTDNLYKTADLTAVSYNFAQDVTTAEGLFNSRAADAFYGVAAADEAAVTLTRPFARINLRPSAEADAKYSTYQKVGVTMKVPTKFNVAESRVATELQAVTYTGDVAGMNPYTWFSFYAFSSTDDATLGADNDIALALSENTDTSVKDETVTVAGEDVQIATNVYANINVTPLADNTSTVTVTFPGDMTDPDAPKPVEPMALGDFIYKDGTHGKELNANTIGIVFKLASDDVTDTGTYEEGKKVAGYAMALCTTTRGKVGSTFPEATLTADAWADGDYNGFTYSPKFLTAISGSDENTYYTNLTTDYKKDENSTLISDWYVPSAVQIREICQLVFGFGNTEGFKPAAANAVKAAYEKVYQEVQIAEGKKYGTLLNFGREAATTYILSSSSDANSGYAISIISTAANEPSAVKQQTIEKANWETTSASIRPVLTIFEAPAAQ